MSPVEIVTPLLNADMSEEINSLVASHTTLEKILVWGIQQSPPVMISEIIAQDEFTNDIIVPFQSFFLVYDTT